MFLGTCLTDQTQDLFCIKPVDYGLHLWLWNHQEKTKVIPSFIGQLSEIFSCSSNNIFQLIYNTDGGWKTWVWKRRFLALIVSVYNHKSCKKGQMRWNWLFKMHSLFIDTNQPTLLSTLQPDCLENVVLRELKLFWRSFLISNLVLLKREKISISIMEKGKAKAPVSDRKECIGFWTKKTNPLL